MQSKSQTRAVESARVTLTPGIYGSITSSSSGTITFPPGVYVIRGQLKLSHAPGMFGPSVFGHGVTLYFACSSYPIPCAAPGSSGATFQLSGGATADISAPVNGPYQGVSIFFDRMNSSTMTLTGSSTTFFSGTIYARTGTVSLTGPSGINTAFSSAVIARNVIKTGSSALTLDFNPDSNAPALAGASTFGLVE